MEEFVLSFHLSHSWFSIRFPFFFCIKSNFAHFVFFFWPRMPTGNNVLWLYIHLYVLILKNSSLYKHRFVMLTDANTFTWWVDRTPLCSPHIASDPPRWWTAPTWTHEHSSAQWTFNRVINFAHPGVKALVTSMTYKPVSVWPTNVSTFTNAPVLQSNLCNVRVWAETPLPGRAPVLWCPSGPVSGCTKDARLAE